jgi:hypothetical protein
VVKKKIGGASLDEDLRRIDAGAGGAADGQRWRWTPTAASTWRPAIAYAKALSQYDLFWYEEAGDPLDFELQATLRQYYANPMATGENLFSMQDARNLIRYGGMRPDRDWLQFDCALSYGLVEYLRTLEMLKEHGWSPSRCIPHGGHQMSLNIAAGLGLGGNESYPDLFQPFGGFPDGVKVDNGYVTLPDLPGIGFEGKADLYTAAMRSITGDLQGGSTLTQQLARNLYPDEIGRAATITRKLREAITAIKIESVYSKNEILETYLNTVPFLYNAFGIEMAAHTYFDKPAARLDVVEAATLIGMLKGTTYYNPVLNPKRSLQRRNTVLAQMVKRDKLTPERFALLKAQPLRIDFERQNEALGPAPHVTRYLRSWLIEWADRTGHDIYSRWPCRAHHAGRASARHGQPGRATPG